MKERRHERYSPRRLFEMEHTCDYQIRETRLQLLDFECLMSQSITESILVEFLQEIIWQQTSLSDMDAKSIWSVKACLDRAPCLSILFPKTSNGILLKDGLLRRSWSSLFEVPRFSGSAASTTYTIADTARQYLSHILRNLG